MLSSTETQLPRTWYQMAPVIVMFNHGAIIPCHRSEQWPLGQLHTVDWLALHLERVLGCTGLRGSSCSLSPQLLSAQVSLPVVHGGIHCCIVVPPMLLWTRPIGTGSAAASGDAAAISSLSDLPKYLCGPKFSSMQSKRPERTAIIREFDFFPKQDESQGCCVPARSRMQQ